MVGLANDICWIVADVLGDAEVLIGAVFTRPLALRNLHLKRNGNLLDRRHIENAVAKGSEIDG